MDAVIDIGTNTVLLLLGSGVRVIRDEARITGLGRDLQKTFHPESKKRTLIALREYDRFCRQAGVKKVICVGTASFRRAKDGPEFMEEIQKKFGWVTKIISGEEEAGLSYLSVQHDFGTNPNLVALDIGGGSTEIISKESGVSLELGTVVLTESYLKSDPPQEVEMTRLTKAIDQSLLSLNPKPYTPSPVLIALAGTATTLSSVNQKMKIWDPKKIQGSKISMTELDRMIQLFQRSTHDALRMTPGMVPGREDTILAGSLILRAVMEKLGVHFIVVSDRGLRYGLFYQEFS